MKAKNYFYKTLVFSAIWVFACFGVAAFSIKQAIQEDPLVWKKALGRLGMEFTGDSSFGVVFDSDYDKSEDGGNQTLIKRDWKYQTPKKNLKLQMASGEVTVVTGSGTEVKVQASGQIAGDGGDQILLVQENDGELSLKTPDGVQVNNLDVRVEVPSSSRPRVSIQMVSGEALLEKVQFDSLSMRSVSGDMTLKSVAASMVDLKTVSGSVQVDSPSVGLLKVVTLSGPVSVSLPAAGHFDFDLQSVSGSVDNAFSSRQNEKEKIKIRTTSGDIRIFQK